MLVLIRLVEVKIVASLEGNNDYVHSIGFSLVLCCDKDDTVRQQSGNSQLEGGVRIFFQEEKIKVDYHTNYEQFGS